VQRLGHQREGAVGLAGFLLHGLAEGLEDLAGTALLRQAGIEPLQQAAAEVTPAALQIPILAPQPRVERLPIRRAGAAELAVGRLDGHPFVVMDLGLGPRLAGVEGPQHLARIEQALEGLQRQREAPEHQHLLAGTGDLLDRLHRRQQGRVFVQRVAVAGGSADHGPPPGGPLRSLVGAERGGVGGVARIHMAVVGIGSELVVVLVRVAPHLVDQGGDAVAAAHRQAQALREAVAAPANHRQGLGRTHRLLPGKAQMEGVDGNLPLLPVGMEGQPGVRGEGLHGAHLALVPAQQEARQCRLESRRRTRKRSSAAGLSGDWRTRRQAFA
jgi:uncharacterized membrane protein